MRRRKLSMLAALSSAGGCLLSGCLAAIESNLDLLLGFQATDNLLRLPQSVLAPLVYFLTSLV